MTDVALKPGWLARDTRRAAIAVARERVAEAERRVRNANDELTDACSGLKEANRALRVLEQTARDRQES